MIVLYTVDLTDLHYNCMRTELMKALLLKAISHTQIL